MNRREFVASTALATVCFSQAATGSGRPTLDVRRYKTNEELCTTKYIYEVRGMSSGLSVFADHLFTSLKKRIAWRTSDADWVQRYVETNLADCRRSLDEAVTRGVVRVYSWDANITHDIDAVIAQCKESGVDIDRSEHDLRPNCFI